MPSALLYFVPAAMNFIALLEMPYGYYQLLRVVVTGCALAIFYYTRERAAMPSHLILFAIAAIYNPVMKVHMDRDVHVIFNIVTALLLVALWAYHRRIDDQLNS